MLFNIDALDINAEDRRKLRIVALVHDTFKSEVKRVSSRTGDNHHAVVARRFVEKYTNDLDILEITELHDEAYRRRFDFLCSCRHPQCLAGNSPAQDAK